VPAPPATGAALLRQPTVRAERCSIQRLALASASWPQKARCRAMVQVMTRKRRQVRLERDQTARE